MRKLVASFCFALATLGGAANAQSIAQPPEVVAVDPNNMDLSSGEVKVPEVAINIGGSGSGLSKPSSYDSNANVIKFVKEAAPGATSGSLWAYVSISGQVHRFYIGTWMNSSITGIIAGPYADNDSGGTVLTCSSGNIGNNPTGSTCTLLLADGTTVQYDMSINDTSTYVMIWGAATLITRPDGEQIRYNYTITSAGKIWYMKTAWSSLGWMIKSNGALAAVNLSTAYCSVDADTCPTVHDSVTSNGTVVSGITTVTRYRNGIALYTYTSGTPLTGRTGYITISSPSGLVTTYDILKSHINGTNAANIFDKVNTVATRGGKTWIYDYSRSQTNVITLDIKNPDLTTRHLTIGIRGDIGSITDELGRKTSYGYSFHEVSSVIPPEATYVGATLTGGYVSYPHTTWAQPSGVTSVPKAGSGLSNSVTTIHYPDMDSSTCSNTKSCHKPSYLVDANGDQTDYTYSPDHGGILTETGPADATGVRPQTRYSYAQLYPKVLNASGVLVNSTPVWRLTRTSTCRTATAANPAACVGTDQETVTEYEYGSNNLLLTKVTVRAGNANVANAASPTNVWQSTSYDYDVVGNQIMVDGPLPGTVDRSYTVYDALRRPVYEIGIDPDGAGTLPSVTTHHMYDIDGREYRTETGRGNGANMRTCSPTAATCTYFAVTSYVQRFYDATTGLEVKSVTAQP